MEQRTQRDNHRGTGQLDRPVARFFRFDGQQGDLTVEHHHAQRQGGRGPDLAPMAGQPAGVLQGCWIIADAGQINCQHGQAAHQHGLVEWFARLEALRRLPAAGHERQALPPGLVSELFKAALNGVKTVEPLHAVRGAVVTHGHAIRNERGYSGLALSKLFLMGQKLSFLPFQ